MSGPNKTSGLLGSAGTGSLSYTFTGGNLPSVGDWICIQLSTSMDVGATVSTADNQGGANTYVNEHRSDRVGGLDNHARFILGKLTSVSDPLTITVTFTGSSSNVFLSGVMEAWSGLHATAPVDIKIKSTTGSSSTASSGSTGTLGQANEVVFAVLCSPSLSSSTSITTPPSGFSSSFTNPSGAVYEWGDGRYLEVSATTAVQADWTFSANLSTTTVLLITLKKAGGGTTYSDSVAEGSATAADSPNRGLLFTSSVAEGSATAADTPNRALIVFAFPSSDISTGGWSPSTGVSLYPMLDETAVDFSDYIYSPNNPTTQQFEVKLSALGDPVSSVSHGIDIGLQAMGLDTNFDFNLVQGSTVLDSWTENVTVAAGQIVRTRNFSGAVADSITDYSDLRLRGVARA